MPRGDLFALMAQLVERMRRALARRHLERDEGSAGPRIADFLVPGRIDWDENEDGHLPLRRTVASAAAAELLAPIMSVIGHTSLSGTYPKGTPTRMSYSAFRRGSTSPAATARLHAFARTRSSLGARFVSRCET